MPPLSGGLSLCTMSVARDGTRTIFPDFCCVGWLPSAMSVFTAELLAIFMSCKQSLCSFSLLTSICDFSSALQAMSNPNSPHSLVLAILDWLVLLGHRGHRVTFCWVPAHVGIKENKRTDALVKAMASRARPPTRHHPLPAIDLRTQIYATVHS